MGVTPEQKPRKVKRLRKGKGWHNNGDEERLAERRAKAWDLKKAGASCRQIGKQLGVSAMQVFRDLRDGLDEVRDHMAHTIQEHVVIEQARLDAINLAIWPKVQQGDLEAARTAVRVIERRAALLGLDAAKRLEMKVDTPSALVQHTTTNTTVVLGSLDDAQLRAHLSRLISALDQAPLELPPATIDVTPVEQPADPVAAYEAALAKRKGNGHA